MGKNYNYNKVNSNTKAGYQNTKAGYQKEDKMPLSILNYILMLVGVVVIVVGFILMSGGTKATPEVFSDDIYAWHRITLAPILVVAGFAFEIFAILKRFKH